MEFLSTTENLFPFYPLWKVTKGYNNKKKEDKLGKGREDTKQQPQPPPPQQLKQTWEGSPIVYFLGLLNNLILPIKKVSK